MGWVKGWVNDLAGVLVVAFTEDLTGALTGAFAEDLTDALAIKADFFASGFAVTLEAIFATTTGVAGVVATLGRTGVAATVFTELAVTIFFFVVTMMIFPLNKRGIQFISFIGRPSSLSVGPCRTGSVEHDQPLM
nr:hypothetical protein [Rhodoferax sp.]